MASELTHAALLAEFQAAQARIALLEQAQTTLAESEARFRRLAEHSQSQIYRYDLLPTPHFSFVNPAAYAITGYTPDDHYADPELGFRLIHADDLPIVTAAIRHGAAADKPIVARLTRKDGVQIWTEQRIVPVYDGSGHLVAVEGMANDITERVRAEEALRNSEARAQAMLQAIPDLIFRQDRNGVYLDYKADVRDLYAPDASLLLGRSHREFLPADLARLADGAIAAALATGRVQSFEYQLDIPGQGVRAYEARMAPSGQDEVLAVVRDITERKSAADALARSESRLKSLVDSAQDAIITVDANFRIVLFNRAAEQMFQLPAEDALGQSLSNLIPARFRAVHEDRSLGMEFKLATLPLGTQAIPVVGLRADGQEFPAEATVSYLEHNAEKYFTAILRDISERTRAENALRLSEEKYRGLLASLDSVVATVDGEGRFLYMNDLAASQLGAPAGELVGKTMFDLFPPVVAARQMARVHQAIQDDRAHSYEALSLVQGKPRWYRTTIQPIHDETGKVIHALINSTDIHDLKTTQQELLELNRSLEERVRIRTAEVHDLYDNAPAGYHSVAADGRITMINQTALGWLGYTRAEVLGRAVEVFLSPASRAAFPGDFATFKQRGWSKDLEYEFVRKDGTLFPVLINATAVYDGDGNYVTSRTTMLDNTSRKAAAEAQHRANLELERALRTKNEFLANMSHELRTPLTGVLALSEVMLEEIYGPLNERQLKAMRNIDVSGRHLLALINDLLDLSKIEAGKLELQLAEVAVDEVCQASLAFVRELARKKSIQVTYRNDSPRLKLWVDAKRLKQMLINLLSNAVKFTPENGSVLLTVTLQPAARQLQLAVEDTGIGIASEDLPKLFQPFTQLDATITRQYEGTGLGLALVRRLAMQHGGSVQAESAGLPGLGSRFTISLPLAPHGETPASA